jgi:hypothetical protein
VSWLVKVVVGLAIVGLILFDAGSILANYFGLSSNADDAAVQVSTTLGSLSAAQQASTQTCITKGRRAKAPSPFPWCQEAKTIAKTDSARLVSATVDETGVVHITLRRTAHSLVVSRISAIKKWGRATVEGQSGTQ